MAAYLPRPFSPDNTDDMPLPDKNTGLGNFSRYWRPINIGLVSSAAAQLAFVVEYSDKSLLNDTGCRYQALADAEAWDS